MYKVCMCLVLIVFVLFFIVCGVSFKEFIIYYKLKNIYSLFFVYVDIKYVSEFMLSVFREWNFIVIMGFYVLFYCSGCCKVFLLYSVMLVNMLGLFLNGKDFFFGVYLVFFYDDGDWELMNFCSCISNIKLISVEDVIEDNFDVLC